MNSFPRWLILASALGMLVLLCGGAWFYMSQEQHLRQEAEANLWAIAKLKVDQIAQWRAQRLAEAAVLMEGPFLTEGLVQWMANPQPQSTEQILNRFRSLQKNYHCDNVLLVDARGQVRLSIKERGGGLEDRVSQDLAKAFRTRRPVLSGLHEGPDNLPPHLDLIAPFFSGSENATRPVAAVILEADARQFLYPLMQTWPTRSRSAETLLVRKDGDAALFLNDLRHQPDTALKLRIPLSHKDVPAVMAVLGNEGVFSGKDYRGVAVMSVLKAVPNSPWFMVAKVDEAEVMAGWRFRSVLVASLTVSIVAFLFTALGMVWQRNGKAHFRSLFQAEAARRESEERYHVTLMSIGDGVIATDAEGRVELLNQVAEALTGWKQEDARGKQLEEVFRIVNEETHLQVENPVQGVMRHGLVVGLANHTVLIARDGTERPIADSGAPIRDEKGAVTGVVLVFRDQTHEREAQKALQEREAQYRLVFESVNDAMFLHHVNEDGSPGRFIQVNDEACQRLGYTREELLQLTPRDIAVPEDYDKISDIRRDLTSNGKIVFETQHVAKDGRRVMVESNVRLFNYFGKRAALSMSRDITDRKQSEEALQHMAGMLRGVLAASPVGIVLTQDSRIHWANEAWEQMFGFDNESEYKDQPTSIMHPSRGNYELVRKKLYDNLNPGGISETEARLARKDGGLFDAQISVNLLDPSDPAKGTISVISDISQRKRSEEALRESEQRFRRLYEQSPSPYQSLDAVGNILEVNNAWLAELGYNREDVIGKWFGDFLAGDGPALFSERFPQFKARGVIHGVEFEMKRQDGSKITVSFDGRIGRDDRGEFEQTHCVFINITERRRAEAERERLVSAIEQAAEAVVITDAEGNIVYVNPAFERITGYSREEAVGQTPSVLKSGEHDAKFYKELWNTITGGNIWSGRFVNRKKDGSLFHEEATISPVKDASGNITNFVAVKRDITEHLELSKQLGQAQKMEVVGTLAGGVAHDFNNLLQVVLGYSDLMLSDGDLPATYRDDLARINHAARNGADLVQRLLTLSRKTEVKPRPINLNRHIEQLQKMLSRTLPKMIEVELILADGLSAVNADPSQMEQILMNLAINARDAMPDGGKLVIQTENVTLDEHYGKTHLGAKPGLYVMLSVSDTGQGMDKETLAHIFEPFFTTKGPGEGTGLGLAMVYGIVKQHEGHIMCYSEARKGTIFKIYLPALVSEEELRQVERRILPSGGSETILLVDDDEVIRDLGSRVLTNAGYKVLEASNGKEALEMYRACGPEISVVILDLIMPEMGGKQGLQGLLEINPLVKVIIASGYSANGRTKEALQSGAMGFVNKPYDIYQLLEVVRTVLDKEAAQGDRSEVLIS